MVSRLDCIFIGGITASMVAPAIVPIKACSTETWMASPTEYSMVRLALFAAYLEFM